MEPYQLGRLKVWVWSDWSFLWSKGGWRAWNWIDIHWIYVCTELADYKSSFDVTLGLLGFCTTIGYQFGRTEDE